VERKKKKEDKGNNKPNKGLIIINATAIFIPIYQSNKFRNHAQDAPLLPPPSN
jgi:hypothetical protein